MLELIHTIQILEHYLPAIYNDDETGLSDEEIEQLNNFLYPRFNNCTFEIVGEKFFSRDNVSGLMGDVIELNVYKFNKD
jgi:hypothetical protein